MDVKTSAGAALAESEVNVLAIAHGSSEVSISAASSPKVGGGPKLTAPRMPRKASENSMKAG